ncbi:hypothetical protein B4U80_13432, partial [Leptotrombidium deliense]
VYCGGNYGHGGGGYGHGGGGYGHGGHGKLKCPHSSPCTFNGEFIPDPQSCCKYFRCDHCKLVPMKCGPGTHFSAYLKTCDHPNKSGCYDKESE